MKLRRSLALMVALGGLAGGTVTLATAQDKGKTPDKNAPAKEDKKPGGKVEIYEAKKGWRYRIVNDENKTIAMPAKSYEKKDDVLKELDLVKSLLQNTKPIEVKE